MEVVFGGLYRENDLLKNILPSYYEYLNDQKYHWWIPIKVIENGVANVYMIETYQNSIPYEHTKTFESQVAWLVSLGEDKSTNMHYANKPYDYYYTSRVLLTEEKFRAFKLVADLTKYTSIEEEECAFYDGKDLVLYVRLRNDGKLFYLRKTDAKINMKSKIGALCRRAVYSLKSPQENYDWTLKEIEKTVAEAKELGAEYDVNMFDYALKLNEFLKKQRIEYEEFRDRLRKELDLEDI